MFMDSIALKKPRLLITVTTTPPSSAPRSMRSLARIAMILSPSTTSPFSSLASTLSASPSKAKATSCPDARAQPLQDALDVQPRGAVEHLDGADTASRGALEVCLCGEGFDLPLLRSRELLAFAGEELYAVVRVGFV